jgi:hypothetical protein
MENRVRKASGIIFKCSLVAGNAHVARWGSGLVVARLPTAHAVGYGYAIGFRQLVDSRPSRGLAKQPKNILTRAVISSFLELSLANPN